MRYAVRVSTGFLLCLAAMGASQNLTFPDVPVLRDFALFPEGHTDAEIVRYYLQRGEYRREHYFIEGHIYLEPLWVSYRDLVYAGSAFEVNPGMGQTPRNVYFDPMDMSYSFIPFFEVRTPLVNGQVGLDHRCFHELDRKVFDTVYWNKFFLRALSRNERKAPFMSALLCGSGQYRDRFSYYLEWGYFITEFFDVAKPGNINYRNYNVFEFISGGRWAFYCIGPWAFTVEGLTRAGVWDGPTEEGKERRGYWRQELSLAAYFSRGTVGTRAFFRYHIDDMPDMQSRAGEWLPRFSKNGLLEFGVGMYF
jgi:hypothetical protein